MPLPKVGGASYSTGVEDGACALRFERVELSLDVEQSLTGMSFDCRMQTTGLRTYRPEVSLVAANVQKVMNGI